MDRFHSVKIEIDDLESELNSLANNENFDEERAQIVQNQMQAINSLLHKHNCNSGADLAGILEGLENEITAFTDLEGDIVSLKEKIDFQKKTLKTLALDISGNRKSKIKNYEIAVREVLVELGMPNAEIKIDLTNSETLGKNGIDEVNYLFKTNLGGQFLPISKTASGGELSRLMLSILNITASVQHLPTLIFDEIDTGVSGEIASKMANQFAKMGQHTQLISISHLPQIAGKANYHYHVFKTADHDSTTTHVKQLDQSERVLELAKMMSGESVSDKAIENAKQLLEVS